MAESTRVSTKDFYEAQLKTNKEIGEVKELVIEIKGTVEKYAKDIANNAEDIKEEKKKREELEDQVNGMEAKQARWAGFYGAAGMLLGGLLDKIFPGLSK